ncbi:MAG: aspartyl protease family protein [Ferruginibacter sp.]
MPLKRLTLFFLLLLPALANAQDELNERHPSFITSFPFKQYSGGVMVIKAAFENIKDSLNFILDTGSGGISLDSSTCEAYGIDSRQTDTTITGIGGQRKVSFSFNKTLHFPGLDVQHLNFHINNYEILTSVYGEKIDGIIGYSFLNRYIVKINFDTYNVEVYEPFDITYPGEGTLLKPAMSSIPIQFLRFRDRKKMNHNFYFDTGAGLCFLLSEQYAQDSSVLLAKRKPLVTQAEGMLGRVQMRLTVVRELKLGPYQFFNVPTYLYKDDYNVLRYPFAAGLFGNELLRRFNMILNYKKHEIHLSPNTHFTEPFDYSYTGLGMYFIDGEISVEDIAPGSPAEKAGFKLGDQIICVGNNCTKNIQAYKNILLVANQSIKVTIKRKEKLLQLQLKTISIL